MKPDFSKITDDSTLMCCFQARTEQGREALMRPGVRVFKCTACSCEIAVSAASIETAIGKPNMKLICIECFYQLRKERPEMSKDDTLAPISNEQLEEMEKWEGRKFTPEEVETIQRLAREKLGRLLDPGTASEQRQDPGFDFGDKPLTYRNDNQSFN